MNLRTRLPRSFDDPPRPFDVVTDHSGAVILANADASARGSMDGRVDAVREADKVLKVGPHSRQAVRGCVAEHAD